jgi:hypothetical protein
LETRRRGGGLATGSTVAGWRCFLVPLLLRRGLASGSRELMERIDDLLEVRVDPNTGSLDGVLGDDGVSVGGLGLLTKALGARLEMLEG